MLNGNCERGAWLDGMKTAITWDKRQRARWLAGEPPSGQLAAGHPLRDGISAILGGCNKPGRLFILSLGKGR
jgi:hypothetical protein